MKVLHVIDTLDVGGAERLLAMLVPELARQGIGGAVAVRGGGMALANEIEAAGIPVHRLAPRHRWNLPGMAGELGALAGREGADVIHAHLYFPAVATALMRVLRRSTAATCVTFHNLAYAGANRAGPGLAWRKALARQLYPRGIDACFAVSQAVASHYQAALGLAGVDVIPNPVDLAALAPIRAASPPSSARGSACTIAVAGRLVPEKGHADLLQAMALLAAQGLEPRLEIIGDGPLRPAIEAQAARLGLSARMAITGIVRHADLLARIGQADLVVVPSRHEGFGMTALESMAMGRTVVATGAGGLPEVLGDAGVVVPARDPAALATAMARLLDDPGERARLGSEAARRAEGFALPRIAERHAAAYRALLERRG